VAQELAGAKDDRYFIASTRQLNTEDGEKRSVPETDNPSWSRELVVLRYFVRMLSYMLLL
jgi:hypothetical protein